MMAKLLHNLTMTKKVIEISPEASETDPKDTAVDKYVDNIEPKAKIFFTISCKFFNVSWVMVVLRPWSV